MALGVALGFAVNDDETLRTRVVCAKSWQENDFAERKSCLRSSKIYSAPSKARSYSLVRISMLLAGVSYLVSNAAGWKHTIPGD